MSDENTSGGSAAGSDDPTETTNNAQMGESGVPSAPTKLGVVPSSYGEPGGAGPNAEGLPPA